MNNALKEAMKRQLDLLDEIKGNMMLLLISGSEEPVETKKYFKSRYNKIKEIYKLFRELEGIVINNIK